MKPGRDALLAAAAVAMVVLLAPVLVKVLGAPGPDAVDTGSLSRLFGAPAGPGASHWFGVDWLGRDVLSRTIYGMRVSLSIGVLTAAGATLIGVCVGVAAGMRGGLVDSVISRLTETFLVVPYLLLALGLAASCSTSEGCLHGAVRPGVPLVVFVFVVASWPVVARIARNEVLSLKEAEFVSAARLSGASDLRIFLRELLPNLLPPILVIAVAMVPQVIVAEAAISYLGAGVPASTPSWGGMIASAAPAFPEAWWLMVFPGAALVTTVLLATILADRLGGHRLFPTRGAVR